VLQKKLFSLANVKVITQALSTEVTGDGKKVNGLMYTDRSSGEGHRVDLEGVFVQIGLLPNSEWLKGTIALSPRRRDRDRCPLRKRRCRVFLRRAT
jgi:alkyl hydroperoxide reductase subunit F